MVADRCGIDSDRGNAGLSSRKLGVGAREDEEALGARKSEDGGRSWSGRRWGRALLELQEEEDGEEKENTAAGKDKAGDGGYR